MSWLLRFRAYRRSLPWLLAAASALLCGPTWADPKIDFPGAPAPAGPVLIMPLDVELGEVTGTGIYKVRADWTQAAQDTVRSALESRVTQAGRTVTRYSGVAGPEVVRPAHLQTVKLHQALESTLLRYAFGGAGPGRPALPTRPKLTDWTLGDAVAPLRADTGADIALFVHLRDLSPTAGRTAMDVAALVLFGAVSMSGQQSGFASLVDLRSGALLWANISSRAFGDLRSPGGARAAIGALLDKAPL